MAKKKLTANDLDKTLRDFGFKEDDEIYLSSDETESNAETNEGGQSQGGEGDGSGGDGGSNNPPKKPPFEPAP